MWRCDAPESHDVVPRPAAPRPARPRAPLLDLDLQRVEPSCLPVCDIRCATGPSERAGVTDLSTALPIKGVERSTATALEPLVTRPTQTPSATARTSLLPSSPWESAVGYPVNSVARTRQRAGGRLSVPATPFRRGCAGAAPPSPPQSPSSTANPCSDMIGRVRSIGKP